MQKIAAACPEHVSFDWQDLDAALSVKAAGVVPAEAQLFAHLLDAVMNRQEVVFDYHKLKGQRQGAASRAALIMWARSITAGISSGMIWSAVRSGPLPCNA